MGRRFLAQRQPTVSRAHSRVWWGRWELHMSCWGFSAVCPHSSLLGVQSAPAHDRLSEECPAAELHLSPEPEFGLMPERSLLEERDGYLVNIYLMNPVVQVGGTKHHLCVWCMKTQWGKGKIITGEILWQHPYLTLFMWNQLKGELNLASDDAISKSSNIFSLSVFICFWQRCNSKNWITFITWCVWPQTGEFLDKPIHLFKDLIHLTQNQQLRQKPITKQVFGGVWHNRKLQAAPSTVVALDTAGVTHTHCSDSHRLWGLQSWHSLWQNGTDPPLLHPGQRRENKFWWVKLQLLSHSLHQRCTHFWQHYVMKSSALPASYLIYISQAGVDVLCKFPQETDRALVENMDTEEQRQQTLAARNILCGEEKVTQCQVQSLPSYLGTSDIQWGKVSDSVWI